jgi:ribosome biogenesis GTPase
MSKRRISQKQSARIAKRHSQHRQLSSAEKQEGLVITRFGHHTQIESPEGVRIHCSIRPSIDSLVAGDAVVWQMEGESQGVVISRYPRRTVLGRPDKKGVIRPVAANITQLIIVVAAKPEISWPLLDSYLVMAEYLTLKASIVLNKIDLPCNDIQQRLADEYVTLGYPILKTALEDNRQFKNLLQQLNNEVSVFVGQSGVGKSSIIARVLPEEGNISIGTISSTQFGRHTTTNSCFYHLPTGGALIDSPGVRELGLWHMAATDIARGYREFSPYLGECKFRDCDHKTSPGCSLIEAVKKGVISRQRYNNYVKITSQFAK